MSRRLCKDKNLEKKKKAFEEMRIISHYANKVTLFPKYPRTYGKPLPDIKQIENLKLNDIRKKLIGY